jgi:hypothetical protein
MRIEGEHEAFTKKKSNANFSRSRPGQKRGALARNVRTDHNGKPAKAVFGAKSATSKT